MKSYPVVWGLLHKRLNVGIPIKHPLFSDWGLMETLKRLKASPQDESFGWVKLGFRGCLDYGKPFHVRISSWFVHKIYIIQPKHLVSRGKSTYREIHSIRYIYIIYIYNIYTHKWIQYCIWHGEALPMFTSELALAGTIWCHPSGSGKRVQRSGHM